VRRKRRRRRRRRQAPHTEKDRLVLVHASVREEERWVVMRD
jgi:hypothetical protein